VSREAKKRLSERWKMTHKSQDLGVGSRGSTLAEMLAIPDKDTMPANLDGMSCADGISDKFASDDGPTGGLNLWELAAGKAGRMGLTEIYQDQDLFLLLLRPLEVLR
jgi:hypothetical protein